MEKTKVIEYCECGQAVRLRKRDNKYIHIGYNKIHEAYSEFLERTNHAIQGIFCKKWRV